MCAYYGLRVRRTMTASSARRITPPITSAQITIGDRPGISSVAPVGSAVASADAVACGAGVAAGVALGVADGVSVAVGPNYLRAALAAVRAEGGARSDIAA